MLKTGEMISMAITANRRTCARRTKRKRKRNPIPLAPSWRSFLRRLPLCSQSLAVSEALSTPRRVLRAASQGGLPEGLPGGGNKEGEEKKDPCKKEVDLDPCQGELDFLLWPVRHLLRLTGDAGADGEVPKKQDGEIPQGVTVGEPCRKMSDLVQKQRQKKERIVERQDKRPACGGIEELQKKAGRVSWIPLQSEAIFGVLSGIRKRTKRLMRSPDFTKREVCRRPSETSSETMSSASSMRDGGRGSGPLPSA